MKSKDQNQIGNEETSWWECAIAMIITIVLIAIIMYGQFRQNQKRKVLPERFYLDEPTRITKT